MHQLLSFIIVSVALFKTSMTQSLCDGSEQGVSFNPYPWDCTMFVQCFVQGKSVLSLVRKCPFGQFWDADAITCRPSFLVACPIDACKHFTSGFTYGMKEYGCRAYWKCIDGFSVGHCCPRGSAYVDGIGCLEDAECNVECPPSGEIAVRPAQTTRTQRRQTQCKNKKYQYIKMINLC